MPSVNRRTLLNGAALAPLAGLAGTPVGAAAAEELPPIKFTLSVNLELMFPGSMPMPKRIELVADQGFKAYSFWGFAGRPLDEMLAVQKRTGLKCGSITGNAKTGWGTGLTKTGFEQAFLDDIREHCEVANRFEVQNLICFAGAKQADIPWEVQYRQIIEGLKKAGDIAAKHDVFVVLEPLNYVESPQMSVLSARDGLKIVSEVNHPNVKLDFDMYHLQLGEGNLTNNLKTGIQKGWIRFVEIGDVPGRFEPGTGETNYPMMFKALREVGYSGYVGMEHRSTSTPEHAMQTVKKLVGV
jgi:hydroxypyruvate isomerase